MERIEWQESFELGIPEIDVQHRMLFNIVRILLDSIEQSRADEVIEEILEELGRYTHYHAETEERHFGEGENFEEHKEVHQKFKDDIAGFKAMYDDQSDEEFIEMMSFYYKHG